MNELLITIKRPGGFQRLGRACVSVRPNRALDHQALFCTVCGKVWAELTSNDPHARWSALHTLCPACGGNGSVLSYLWHRRTLSVDRGLAVHELSTFNPATPDRTDLVAAG